MHCVPVHYSKLSFDFFWFNLIKSVPTKNVAMGLKQDRLKFLEQNQTTMCIPKNFARCFFVQLVFYVWLVDYSILLTARQDEFIHVF